MEKNKSLNSEIEFFKKIIGTCEDILLEASDVGFKVKVDVFLKDPLRQLVGLKISLFETQIKSVRRIRENRRVLDYCRETLDNYLINFNDFKVSQERYTHGGWHEDFMSSLKYRIYTREMSMDFCAHLRYLERYKLKFTN